MPGVVKNLLIINGLFFLAKFVLIQQGIDDRTLLGLHYPSSQFFAPYQIATHFFMHGDFMHILFNMFALVVFGSTLERKWGPKRFLVFYFITAIGSAFLYSSIQAVEIYQLTGEIFPQIDISNITYFTDGSGRPMVSYNFSPNGTNYGEVCGYYLGNTVGASGAVYGLIAAFGLLFPNTEFLLYFAFRVKAKWIAIAAAIFALYSGIQNNPDDSIAHFAHLGGMLFAFILIKIWQRGKSNFY